jgi:hypothetical protein
MITNTTQQILNPLSLFIPRGITDHGIVSTALKLGIFEALEHDFLNLKEIKEKLNLKVRERNLQDLMDKLHFNKHLLREGKDLSSVMYKNAHNYLVKSNIDNFIPFVEMTDRINKRYEILPYMIKEGKFPDNLDIFTELYSDENKIKAFLRTMGLFQKENFEGIAKNYDFSKFNKMVDIGGCLGNFSVAVKTHNPHMTCVNYDLPVVEPHTVKYLAEKNMQDQIEIVKADMFQDEFPRCNVFAMGNILHDWDEEKKRFLLKKSYDALEENGILIVVEIFIHKEREVEELGLDLSFHMLLETCYGYNMARSELDLYAKEAGFKEVEYLADKFGVEAAVLHK